ncbi:hypothetical protein ACFWNR_06250 [Streptomyces virginiae]|uniref:hypothetical protein n=1 Tax=Streptomyces virginiae TaxID=1961 RepID=UPI00364F20B8
MTDRPPLRPGQLPALDFTVNLLNGDTITYAIDRAAPADRRHRAICRGLLQHALHLLDQVDAGEHYDLAEMPVAQFDGSSR